MSFMDRFSHVTIEPGGQITISVSDGTALEFTYDGELDDALTPSRFATLQPVEQLFGAELVSQIIGAVLRHDLTPVAPVVQLH